MENRVDIYTKGVINYPHSTASFTLGIGVKTEGNLVISGTKGYIYVPAPWWLTDFFDAMKTRQRTRNFSIVMMVMDCVMKFKNGCQ